MFKNILQIICMYVLSTIDIEMAIGWIKVSTAIVFGYFSRNIPRSATEVNDSLYRFIITKI